MALISVNGKAGSGKDTVGKIIQDLTCEKTKGYSGILNQEVELIGSSYWEIKKYSDKLKDMVCLLIGCTREQLEDQEFKSTPLGKEWWVYTWRGMSYSEKQVKEEMLPEYQREAVLIKTTPRDILQKLGTDFGRNMIHPDVWINALFSEYEGDDPTGMANSFSEFVYPCWIITDSRFPNDVEKVKSLGGITIRVNRPECEDRIDEHFSETALDNYEGFNYIINNNGTIEELIEKVKVILIKENIIK
jgi:hypothetical protein